MLTERDREVIMSIGKYRVLTTDQIINLHFPSYQTCQRRLRRELIPKRYVNEPFYLGTDRIGNRIPAYNLGRNGKKEYKDLTGEEYRDIKMSAHYLPHIIEVNNILIHMQNIVKSFRHEYVYNTKVHADAYCRLTTGLDCAIEIDLSERESKFEIQRQYKNYEDLYRSQRRPELLIIFSNRADLIADWIDEVTEEVGLKVYTVKRQKKYIEMLVRAIKR